MFNRVAQAARWRRKAIVSRLKSLNNRLFHEVTDAQMSRCLEGLVESPRAVILTHSSLSRCGYVQGGPAAVVQTLREMCYTLCLPTHTYCYPRPDGTTPLYDPRQTESCVGAITNFFWREWPGAIRSIHPSHSIAAEGSLASEISAGHELCDTPCGRGTPYEHLISLDASVIMFGANLHTYTLFHTAEDAAGCPYLYFPQPVQLQALDQDGKLHKFNMQRQDMTVERRFRQMDKELENAGLLKRAALGKGEVLFIPSSSATHTFMVDLLRKDPWHLVAKSHRHEVQTTCA
jgi:aminoglycoside 3-N-acetyltransferase